MCRICRMEAEDDWPLYHPCRCSGSIKYVHQDCLQQWMQHSSITFCELCTWPARLCPPQIVLYPISPGLTGDVPVRDFFSFDTR